MNEGEKYFLNSLRYASCHAALSLHFVSLGAYNKGYTVRGSARPSPKFFFHFVPEKLRISLTLSEMTKNKNWKSYFWKFLKTKKGGQQNEALRCVY